MDIEVTTWTREDWRGEGQALRWHCGACGRYGPYDTSPGATARAAVEHKINCKGS